MTDARVGQVVVEALEKGTPAIRAGQVLVEALEKAVPTLRAGQFLVEVLVPPYVPPYVVAVLSDAPKGYWRFEETSGTTAADSSGYGHPGTVTAGSDLSATGKVDSGISFPGGYTGDKVTIGAGNVLGTGWTALSVEGWFKTTTAAGSSIVDNYDGGAANERNWTLRLNSGGSLNWRVGYDAWSEQSITSPATGYHDGNWHHVVGTWDGAIARLYVDGALVVTSGSAAGTLNLSAVSSLRIGVGQGLSFAGTIDEVAVYSTALSLARIQAHYEEASPVTGPSWSVWNGTSEVSATVTVWNGTSEVATTTEIAP